jgi:hypothetical protein
MSDLSPLWRTKRPRCDWAVESAIGVGVSQMMFLVLADAKTESAARLFPAFPQIILTRRNS